MLRSQHCDVSSLYSRQELKIQNSYITRCKNALSNGTLKSQHTPHAIINTHKTNIMVSDFPDIKMFQLLSFHTVLSLFFFYSVPYILTRFFKAQSGVHEILRLSLTFTKFALSREGVNLGRDLNDLKKKSVTDSIFVFLQYF